MKLLFTSFQTWRSHQKSNSSDDLLQILIDRGLLTEHYFLRQIPVDFAIAPTQTIAKIEELQPDHIVCCGMAETRSVLSLESNGKCKTEILKTRFDLEALISGTASTEISHDAGDFVCNHLYYSVLKYLEQTRSDRACLFVHVPVLTTHNLDVVVQDFLAVVDRILSDDKRYDQTRS